MLLVRVRQPGADARSGGRARDKVGIPAHWEPASPRAPPSRPDHRWRKTCRQPRETTSLSLGRLPSVFPDANPGVCCFKHAAMIVVQQWAIKRAADLSDRSWSEPRAYRATFVASAARATPIVVSTPRNAVPPRLRALLEHVVLMHPAVWRARFAGLRGYDVPLSQR